jgi:hypothetical protein
MPEQVPRQRFSLITERSLAVTGRARVTIASGLGSQRDSDKSTRR